MAEQYPGCSTFRGVLMLRLLTKCVCSQLDSLVSAVQSYQSSKAEIGDALVDSDLKDAFAHPPKSYKAVKSELEGYALDTVHIRQEAEGLAPTDAAQKKASEELKSYRILNFNTEHPERPHVRHGKGSAYESRHESRELSSYSNILSFEGQNSDVNVHSGGVGKNVDELASYRNILSFSSKQQSAPRNSEKMKAVKPFVPSTTRTVIAKAPASKMQRSGAKPARTLLHPTAQTTKLFETSWLHQSSVSSSNKLNPEMPLARDWMKLWKEALNLEKQGPAADRKEVKAILSALAEVKHAIVKESYDPAETQKFDASFLRKDLQGVNEKLGELDPSLIKAEKRAKADVINCQICLRKWSPTALACSLQSCHEKLSEEETEQLSINNEIAAAFKGCVGSLTPETAHIRAVVKDFVLPWKAPDTGGSHSWVETAHASPGLQGLGLESGQTAKLEMGHAVYVSAAATRCGDTHENLAQLLSPLADRQKNLNERLIRQFEIRKSANSAQQLAVDAFSSPRHAPTDSPVTAVLAWRPEIGNKRSMLSYAKKISDPWKDFVDTEDAEDSSETLGAGKELVIETVPKQRLQQASESSKGAAQSARSQV